MGTSPPPPPHGGRENLIHLVVLVASSPSPSSIAISIHLGVIPAPRHATPCCLPKRLTPSKSLAWLGLCFVLFEKDADADAQDVAGARAEAAGQVNGSAGQNENQAKVRRKAKLKTEREALNEAENAPRKRCSRAAMKRVWWWLWLSSAISAEWLG